MMTAKKRTVKKLDQGRKGEISAFISILVLSAALL